MSGNHIHYWDDTGFEADGNFIDGMLHHIGQRFLFDRSWKLPLVQEGSDQQNGWRAAVRFG